MPTLLRPNGINYVTVANAEDTEVVVATVQQPIPSSDQAETLIQYFSPQISFVDDTETTLTYRCYRYGVDGAGTPVLGTQVPGEYILTVAVADSAPIVRRNIFLLWVDREPGQASSYAITCEITDDEPDFNDGGGPALATIGA